MFDNKDKILLLKHFVKLISRITETGSEQEQSRKEWSELDKSVKQLIENERIYLSDIFHFIHINYKIEHDDYQITMLIDNNFFYSLTEQREINSPLVIKIEDKLEISIFQLGQIIYKYTNSDNSVDINTFYVSNSENFIHNFHIGLPNLIFVLKPNSVVEPDDWREHESETHRLPFQN